MSDAAQELLEQTLAKLPVDEPGTGAEWVAAEDAVIACRRLQRLLKVYPPGQVVAGLEIVERLLRECPPATAIGRLKKWRAERMESRRKLTIAELKALTVAGVIEGDEP